MVYPPRIASLFFALAVAASVFAADVAASQESPSQFSSTGREYPRFGLPSNQEMLEQGGRVYKTYCMGCHGIQGDGKGAAAAFLNPKPRNFKTAEFRFSSRPSGELPTDEDLYRTLNEGLTGSSMPSWKLLPEYDKKAVIAYIKTFAPEKWNTAPGPVTTIAEDPYGPDNMEKAIKRGETAYHGMAMCYSCHASYLSPAKINEARAFYKMPPMKAFRKDIAQAKSLTTNDGSVIVPPDFTWDKVKRGADLQTLYHVIGNGITGTPMPTWKGVLPEEDLWGIVYYVKSLIGKRRALVSAEDLRKHKDWIQTMESERIAFEAEMKKADAAAKQAKAEAAKLAAATPSVKESASV